MQDNAKSDFHGREVPPRDLEKLLLLAQEIQEGCDRGKSRIQLYKIYLVLMVVAIAVIVVLLAQGFSRSRDLLEMWPFVGSVVILVVPALLTFQQIMRRENRQLKRDYRALAEVVQLLNETYAAIAKEQEWPPLELVHFRIRLSRFDIGEKAYTKEHEVISLLQIRKEWDALAPERQTFWKVLEQCYVQDYLLKSDGKQGYPDTIGKLVDLAQPPRALPLPQQEHLRDYHGKYGQLLTGDDARLYKFCSKVYPPKQPSHKLEDYSLISSSISEKSFNEFHEARGKLAKFWNRCGEMVYTGGIISLDTIVRSFGTIYPLLKILSYLEVCLVQWTQDPGVGKEWLFRLTRDWQDVERRSRRFA